jgi:hypothetical protein
MFVTEFPAITNLAVSSMEFCQCIFDESYIRERLSERQIPSHLKDIAVLCLDGSLQNLTVPHYYLLTQIMHHI